MRRTFRMSLLALLVVVAPSAFPQSTTATIRGKVTNESGNAVANAEVNAVNAATGFVVTVHSRPDGSYQLGGVVPGEINLVVAAQGYEPRTDNVVVRVGQNLDLDLKLTPTAVVSESITVVGNQLVETRTAEAATNVTPLQIEALPQSERNFLNFAALAPGIRLSTDPLRKTFSGDAQPAEQTNIFIDGVSFKNDVLQGGAAGQDASRGNPFPQNAVQEFRVITQNYSAQYDKASSAIITAITKSGGNQLDGQVFVFYQPKQWVSPSPNLFPFQFSTLSTNPSYKRYQSGISIGGPIIKDKLHFFASYEGDQQHATTPVVVGNALYAGNFSQFFGVFPSPFHQTLGFGKLSWQPAGNQIVDVTTNYRREHEVRDFGAASSFASYESATDLRNWVYGGTAHHQWNNNSALNQATVSLQRYGWNPRPLNPNLVGKFYEGTFRTGGASTTQEFDQRRLEFRDDYNVAPFKWQGEHSIQVGGNLDFLHYMVNKSLNGNPQYNFHNPTQTPFEAVYGFGNPILRSKNREYGIYGEDNWTVNQHFTTTLGLRWDYESHMLDENYVTPAAIVAGLTGKVSSDYFSTGSERKPYKKEIQPRLGFSYDLHGDSKSVIFGGAGRYYDRLFLNAALDERFRLQFPVYRIQFVPKGTNPIPSGAIEWNDQYLTKAGLDALIASGQTHPEIFLLNNKTQPPYADQWNLGFRQAFGSWLGSVSYNYVRGHHGFTWLSATGLCCSALVPGFGNVLISDNNKSYWYNGIYFVLDRPYTGQSKWGAHLAWTHGKAEQNGNDLFSLDYPSAAAYPKHEVPGSERDRIVATGIFGLPWDVRFSTLVSLGTGGATNVLDFSKGFSLANRLETQPFKRSIYPPRTNGLADRSVDFRLEKSFHVIGSSSVAVIGEMFNAFNSHNFGCLANFVPPEGNPSLGKPSCVVNLGRREQLGLRVKF